MKRFVLATLALTLLAAAGPAAAVEGLKIGYIIVPRLMTETKAGKDAAAELKKRIGEAQKGLESKLKTIQQFEQDIEKRMMVLSDEEKEKAGEEHEKQMREARRMKEDYQAGLKKTEAEVMEKVNVHLRGVIEKFGKENGYDIILDASSLLYVSEAADLTEAVIKAADAAR